MFKINVQSIVNSTPADYPVPVPVAFENPIYGLGHTLFLGSAAARLPIYATTLVEHLKNKKLKNAIGSINKEIQTAKNINTEKALTYGTTGLALGTTAGLLGNRPRTSEQTSAKYSYMKKDIANFNTFLNVMGIPIAGVGIWWLDEAIKNLKKTRLEGRQLLQTKQLATNTLASENARNKYMGLAALPTAGLGYLGAKTFTNQNTPENNDI